MTGDRIKCNIVYSKLLTNIEDIMLKEFELPEGCIDIGIFTTQYDGVGYCAADEATKAANVDVVYIKTLYGSGAGLNDGQVFGVITGPTVSDVESGLRYIRDFAEKKASVYSVNKDDTNLIYAELVPKIGKYFSKTYGLPIGSSIAFLFAPALEGIVGIDEALTVADVEVVKFFGPPTNSNLSGIIVTGTQSNCKTACEAFKKAIIDCVNDPVKY
ncbi:MAG: ethanolamine utilization microcompartment protein EutL [Eubacteriaceae bacterium]|nr:ethanolamine utilization microcompartment protein EutL [Eubacteriaceae bacterium]